MRVHDSNERFKNKMGHEVGGFEAFFTQLPPLVIVCHEFNQLSFDGYTFMALRWSEMSVSISCQAKAVSTSCQGNM